jgi:basic membrane lipoprotein Med (substrate-binding protein (PBP1-ABC) superfamily)
MRKYFSIIATLAIAGIFLAACATKAKQKNLIAEAPDIKRERDHAIYITSVKDGKFKKKTYEGSGIKVANMFEENIRFYAKETIMGQENDDLANDFAEAKEKNAYYLVKPSISHWEPRAAAFSNKPTQIIIHVSVYAVSDSKEIISRNLEVTGRSISYTNQSPEGLANNIINEFCKDVFE